MFPQFPHPQRPSVLSELGNSGAASLACTSGLMGNESSRSAGSLTLPHIRGSHHALARYSRELPDSPG